MTLPKIHIFNLIFLKSKSFLRNLDREIQAFYGFQICRNIYNYNVRGRFQGGLVQPILKGLDDRPTELIYLVMFISNPKGPSPPKYDIQDMVLHPYIKLCYQILKMSPQCTVMYFDIDKQESIKQINLAHVSMINITNLSS